MSVGICLVSWLLAVIGNTRIGCGRFCESGRMDELGTRNKYAYINQSNLGSPGFRFPLEFALSVGSPLSLAIQG